MSSIIDHFITITQIPHCSQEASRLRDYLKTFAEGYGYDVAVDAADNILVSRGKPRICLQAHYDMVCMGSAPDIRTYEEDGRLRASDSSLGADNGIAIAMMMELMTRGTDDIEFLLTSDEEIGLIGAGALSFDIRSPRMLNIDSEDEAEVYIGCAGGVDAVALKRYPLFSSPGQSYRLTVSGLPGGHSGVDIDKGIPNAIKVLASHLAGKNVDIVSLRGGERRNSIPAAVEAVVKSEEPLASNGMMQVEAIEDDRMAIYGSDEIISVLHGFVHGVHEMDHEFRIPGRSANLAIVTIENGGCRIETSLRAMDPQGLERISRDTAEHFSSYGFDVMLQDKYPSWKPQVNSFTGLVSEAVSEVFGTSKLVAIHAGLECGVIYEKYPHLQIASIGPTIRFPHSIREEVELESVERTFKVVEDILERLKAMDA